MPSLARACNFTERPRRRGGQVIPVGASTAEPRGDLTAPSTALESMRSAWLSEVGNLLEAENAKRAQDMRIAGLVSETKDRSAVVEVMGRKIAINKWHAARANGIERKWERIDNCRHTPGAMRAACTPGCENHGKCTPLGCGHRECPKCRKLRMRKVQKNLRRARISLTEQAKSEHCNRRIRSRFLTLTAPHYSGKDDENATRRRVRILFDAWKYFAKWFHAYQVEKSVDKAHLCHHFRVFEWTEGSDGLGHPHFHIWVHGPFLNQDTVHDVWRDCLERASGESREDVALPDIRLATPGLEKELIKYMLKDLSGGSKSDAIESAKMWRFVPPSTVAALQSEMIGRRIRQTSRGLAEWVALALKREVPPICLCCGIAFDYSYQRDAAPSSHFRCTDSS